MDDPDVSLLVGLAKEKGIRVTEAGDSARSVSCGYHYQKVR